MAKSKCHGKSSLRSLLEGTETNLGTTITVHGGEAIMEEEFCSEPSPGSSKGIRMSGSSEPVGKYRQIQSPLSDNGYEGSESSNYTASFQSVFEPIQHSLASLEVGPKTSAPVVEAVTSRYLAAPHTLVQTALPDVVPFDNSAYSVLPFPESGVNYAYIFNKQKRKISQQENNIGRKFSKYDSSADGSDSGFPHRITKFKSAKRHQEDSAASRRKSPGTAQSGGGVSPGDNHSDRSCDIGLSSDNSGLTRHQRFIRTRDVLECSGLLAVTMNTAELIKGCNHTNTEIKGLKEETQDLLRMILNNKENAQIKEFLLEKKREREESQYEGAAHPTATRD